MAERTADDRLTLELGAARIPASLFAQSIESFLTLIREVAASVTGREDAIRWYVTVSEGSARVHAFPEPVHVDREAARTVVHSVQRGVALLYTHSERPRHFSDRALDAARKLAELSREEDGAVPIRVLAGDSATLLASSTVLHVESLLGPHTEALGSIEGRIETISERGKAKFFVYDALTDRGVRCYFDESRFEDVVDAFKERRRVIVSGLIRYRRDGEPVSLRVESLRTLPDRDRLPGFADVLGILRDGD